MLRLSATLLLAFALTSASCAGAAMVASGLGVSPAFVNLNGVWSGPLTLIGFGPLARVTWTLTQKSGSVTGPVVVDFPDGPVVLNGTLSGKVVDSTLAYAIDVAAGGVPSQPTCTARLTGAMTLADGVPAFLTGSYTFDSRTCDTTLFAFGVFTLTKFGSQT